MNKEELKLLEKIVNLPKELNIEIRGLILAEVVLREENQELKEKLQQKEDIINKARKYLRENEKEYGSLEDNEKIILRIIDNKGE